MTEQDQKQLGQLPLRRIALYTENNLSQISKSGYFVNFNSRFFITTRKMMINMALHLRNLQELHFAQVALGELQIDASENLRYRRRSGWRFDRTIF